MSLLHELRRRRVFRTFALYVVGSWVLIQVAQAAFEAWEFPIEIVRYLWIGLVLISPLALFFAWRYDITSEGIVRTRPASADDVADLRLKWLDYVVLAGLLAIGIAIVVGGVGRVHQAVEEAADAAVEPEPHANSIAVLPFRNLDSNPDTGYFSDGVTEEILHRLSTLGRLHVLASNSSFAFRDSNEAPGEIGRKLGVRYLLQGSIRRDGDHVRVTTRLTDSSGFQLWSDAFDRRLTEIFIVQTEIANTVCGQIIEEILPPRELPAGRTTQNMEAYDAYLIGKSYEESRTQGWREKATSAFQQAIDLDSGFAPPYAGLAVAMTVNSGRGPQWEAARLKAEEAVRLDPLLAEGHAILGLIQAVLDEPERGLESLQRAIRLDPSLSIAYSWIGFVLGRLDMDEEAAEFLRRGLEIDPLNPILARNVAFGESWDGDFQRAEHLLQRLSHLPEPPARAHAWLNMLYDMWGRYAEAVDAAKNNLRMHEDGGEAWRLAQAYANLGMADDADYWFGVEPDQTIGMAYAVFKRLGDSSRLTAQLRSLENDNAFETSDDPAHINFRAGLTYIQVGEFEQGIARVERGLALYQQRWRPENPGEEIDLALLDQNDYTVAILHNLNRLAYAYLATGNEEEATSLLTRLRDFYSPSANPLPKSPDVLAEISLQHALLGEKAHAHERLTEAVDIGWAGYYEAINDPAWSIVVEDSDFDDIFMQVKANVARQRAAVEAIDAVDDFRSQAGR